MNKSIYKKQLAFKNSLPQYKDGGNIFQKAGAGALGVLSKVPIIQSFAPMMENAKIVENNQASFNTGQGIGAVGMVVGKGLTGDIGGAVSSGLDAGKEFMEVGSTVAEQKGNTERADRLDKAAMGFQAGSQAAGMASMMGGNFKSGEGISKMLGFGTMFGNTGGNIPIEMKNGGPLNKSNKKDLIKYNGATHENSPIGGIPIAENGQQLHSGFKSQIPANTKAFAEHGEAYSKDKEYIFSHNPEFKDMNGKTPADKIKAASQIIKGRENDSIAQNSYKRMEARIIEENENMRMKKEIKSNPLMMVKNGGNLPKYQDGNYFNPYGLGSGTVDTFANSTIPTNIMGVNSITNNAPQMTPQFRPTTVPTIGSNYNVTDDSVDALARTQATQRRLSNPLNTAPNTTTPNQQLTLGDKIQLGAEGAAAGALLGMGMKKPEVYKPLTSPLFDSGLADMNQNVRFNTNPILMNRNVGANQINQGSTSDTVRRANLQSLFRGTNTQLGEMAEKKALTNAQIKQSLGQAKIGVGQQDVAAQEKARLMSAEAKAAAQNLRAQGLQTLFGAASNVGKGMNVRQGNTIKMNVLNSLAGQYGVDPKTLEIIFKEQGITTIK